MSFPSSSSRSPSQSAATPLVDRHAERRPGNVNDGDSMMIDNGSDADEQARGGSNRASASFANAPGTHAAPSHPGNSASPPPRRTPAPAQSAAAANSTSRSPTPTRNDHPLAASRPQSASTRLPSAGSSQRSSHSPSSQPSDGSDDEDEYLPGDSQDEGLTGVATSRGREGPKTSSRSLNFHGATWSSAEDALLRAAIERYGSQWQKVAQHFNETISGTSRSPRSLRGRWFALRQDQARTLGPRSIASSTHTTVIFHGAPWSREELQVLQKSIQRRQRRDGTLDHTASHNDYTKALPNSERSASAVRKKCKELLSSLKQGSGVSGDDADMTSQSTLASSVPDAGPGSDFAQARRRRLNEWDGSVQQAEDADAEQAGSEPLDTNSERTPSITSRSEQLAISPPGATSSRGAASSSRRQLQQPHQSQPQQQGQRLRNSAQPSRSATRNASDERELYTTDDPSIGPSNNYHEEGYSSTSHHVERAGSASRRAPAYGAERLSRRNLQPQHRPRELQQAHRAPDGRRRDVDVDVILEHNGVRIESISRGYEVRIYSPHHVKVTAQEFTNTTAFSFGQTFEPAFHFVVDERGAIRGLRLPVDTTTSVASTTVGQDENGAPVMAVDTTFEVQDSEMKQRYRTLSVCK